MEKYKHRIKEGFVIPETNTQKHVSDVGLECRGTERYYERFRAPLWIVNKTI